MKTTTILDLKARPHLRIGRFLYAHNAQAALWRAALALSALMSLNACSVELSLPKKELLREFPVGIGEGKFRFYDDRNTEAPFYPTSIRMTPNGKLFIHDFKNHQIQQFSKDLNYMSTIDGSYTGIEVSEIFLVAFWSEENVNRAEVFLLDGEYPSKISSLEMQFDDKTALLQDVFIEENEIIFHGFESLRGFKLQNDTLQSIPLDQLSKFSVDERYVFSKTQGYLSYSAESFFVEAKKKREIPAVMNGGKKDINGIFGGMVFGIDKHRRRYIFDTYTGNRIGIATEKGDLIRALYLGDVGNAKDYPRYMKPCISPDGDIYYIESSSEFHRFFRIKCEW